MRKDRVILAVTLVILVSVFIAPAVSPSPDGLEGECESCHKSFTAFQTTIEAPSEVPANSDFEYKVTVRNTWKHTVVDLFAILDLSECPELSLTETSPPATESVTGTASFGTISLTAVYVNNGMSGIDFVLEGDEGRLGLNDLDLIITGAEGGSWESTGSGTHEEIRLGRDDIETGGAGIYDVDIQLVRGYSVSYTLTVTSYFGGEDMATLSGPDLAREGVHQFVWKLHSSGKAPNLAKLTVTGTAYHEHEEESENGKTIVDTDTYTFEHESRIVVGDKFVSGFWQSGSTFEALWLSGRILGFVTAGFFVASMTLTRVSGPVCKAIRRKCSKKALDRWHCFVSAGMLVSIVTHFVVLYQGPYAGTTVGMPTGITATAVVAGLFVLGMQKRLIVDRIGMKNWRLSHLFLALTVLLVVVLHMLLNGTSFEWWRELV